MTDPANPVRLTAAQLHQLAALAERHDVELTVSRPLPGTGAAAGTIHAVPAEEPHRDRLGWWDELHVRRDGTAHWPRPHGHPDAPLATIPAAASPYEPLARLAADVVQSDETSGPWEPSFDLVQIARDVHDTTAEHEHQEAAARAAGGDRHQAQS